MGCLGANAALRVAEFELSACHFCSSSSYPQHRRTLPQNNSKDLISLDFLTVSTVSFKVLFVLVIFSSDRHRMLHFYVTDNPTAT